MLRLSLIVTGLLLLAPATGWGQGLHDEYYGDGLDFEFGAPGSDPPPTMQAPAPPVTAGPQPPTRANPYATPPAGYVPPAPLPRRAQNVMEFYSGATSQRVLSQLDNRPSSGRPTTPGSTGEVAPPRQRPPQKPFQGARPAPTTSPYLHLFREESPVGLPNYQTFVLPQIEQERFNRAQQAELNRLRRQVQGMPHGTQSTAMRNSFPNAGQGSRYFNTSGYYPTGSMR